MGRCLEGRMNYDSMMGKSMKLHLWLDQHTTALMEHVYTLAG
jgi:hypothetical protein